MGWIGGKSIEFPFYEIGQGATIFYFLYFYTLFIFDVLGIGDFKFNRKLGIPKNKFFKTSFLTQISLLSRPFFPEFELFLVTLRKLNPIKLLSFWRK